MKQILVLPGGGAKGYLQLSVLKYIETEIIKKPISEYFDLIVGTSVGGLNAAVLASGKIACEKYFSDFKTIASKTFTKNYLLRPPLIRPIYSRKFISNYADNLFGDSLMNSSKPKLIITSVSELDERTHFFKSWESKDGREQIKDVVLRTFAAPYFFGHVVDEENRQVWLDGATGLNNDPTDFAYIEAKRQGWDSFRILVVGTGFSKETHQTFHQAKDNSQLKQILTYLSPISGGLARTQFDLQQEMRYFELATNNSNFKYDYINIEIPKELDIMDNSDVDEYDFYADLMKTKILRVEF
jgi:predicted acylesterase/phospholipase RssA